MLDLTRLASSTKREALPDSIFQLPPPPNPSSNKRSDYPTVELANEIKYVVVFARMCKTTDMFMTISKTCNIDQIYKSPTERIVLMLCWQFDTIQSVQVYQALQNLVSQLKIQPINGLFPVNHFAMSMLELHLRDCGLIKVFI